jgi:hypothetical protein
MIVRQRSTSRWYRRAARSNVHDATVIGRALAACGWLAWQVGHRFRSRRAGPLVLAGVLLAVAALPIVIPMLDPQPEDATVQQVMDGAVTEPTGWVRLRGEVVPLTERPVRRPGAYGLLVDEADTLRAIVVRDPGPIRDAEHAMVTGHVVEAAVLIEDEQLPLDATVFGAPPDVAADRLIQLDAVAKPERVTWWPLSVLPLAGAVLLVIGVATGYPIFRPTSEVDVLSTPLGPGERLPAAWGGRLGPHRRDLADPGAALLVVRPGPAGNSLAAQPLPDDAGPAPQPVPIGGGWSRGRVGWVYTASEAVPALAVHTEVIEATFLFARTGERDRVAALVSVDRD